MPSLKMFGLASLAAIMMGTLGAAHADWSLNVNTALTQDDPMYKGLVKFKEGVEQRTDGKLTVNIFTGSQLGNDEDVLEQARAGANVAVLVDGGRLANFTPEMGILGAPYLVQGYPGARKLVTSKLFDSWAEKLRKASGHQVLSFNWWQGERNLLTSKPVTQPSDLQGVRMRTPGAPVWLETIRAMGATPTPMGWTEVYTALQQGVIDGAEAQMSAVYGARLYEVIKHITKTGHINLITGLVGSAQWFDSLPADVQQIVKDESLKAGDFASELTEKSMSDYEDKMRAKGVSIDTIDVTPFKAATQSVYQKLGYEELRKQVDAVLAQ
ncbi:C4-dicarboxylate TRAP transporter substrate-binding protein [Pokkaliibacter sp. MBI-7]|uniref:C4-dicarboxylate TRAP transporter substrate-binding protein n=1 Tax=Pokkaliibacter sp. MBI-7 TaxID=3040600 RepID=UPI00244C065D|nr:C4-dicarboxylate TRAP transporter substrate-binding protein [Pokkaliibacter sp. MBI-7]MDH2435410.1 C4-dicarboxylate TRAP transporter substrate-binding protein [Pokkaliibacter sp. MBI-7]